jgi:chromosome segregation ATPase
MPTSKPTNIDAQRVVAIMDELKEKLTYLSVVTPQVLEGLNGEEGTTTAEMLGTELMKRMQEQMRLEDIYNVSIQKADGAGGGFLTMDSDDVRETLERLQKNTRELCRKMKDKPTIVADLRNFQETRPANVVQLLRTLADMQDVTLKRLTTTVEEERSRSELLEHYVQREAQASQKRNQLEKDLTFIRREREKASSQRTEVITKLKADLHDVEENTEAKQNTLLRQHEKCMKEHLEKHKALEAKFEADLATLKTKYKELTATNKEVELGKIGKKRRGENDLMQVIQGYDTQIAELTTDYEAQVVDYKKEQKELEELEEHFAKVDMENARLDQEQQIVNARLTKNANKRKKEDDMATLVQSYWKAILDRVAFVAEKKAKKRKQKGGGKKK